jgi:N-acylneuraminate cytidylyltransferase
MIDNKVVSALLPVKAFSRRVENKNIKHLGKYTLLERKILQLQKSKFIDKIYVGSDSDEILKVAKDFGVISVKRDVKACDESQASANLMIKDFVNRVDTDIAVWAHVTNPFVYEKHYDQAIETFNMAEDYDSLVSFTKIQSHMWNKYFFPINFNPYAEKHPFASECDPYYYQNGAIFIQKLDNFKSNSYFYGNKPCSFILDEMVAYDINTPEEFEIAKQVQNYMDELHSFSKI